MTEKKLNNFDLYEIDGELYSLNELKGFIESSKTLSKTNHDLREENSALKVDNDFLQRQNSACKMRCSQYAIENKELRDEIADLRFTHKMLGSEEAGRAFARELLGKPMTEADIAEEKAIVEGEQAYYEMGTALYGDDF